MEFIRQYTTNMITFVFDLYKVFYKSHAYKIEIKFLDTGNDRIYQANNEIRVKYCC